MTHSPKGGPIEIPSIEPGGGVPPNFSTNYSFEKGEMEELGLTEELVGSYNRASERKRFVQTYLFQFPVEFEAIFIKTKDPKYVPDQKELSMLLSDLSYKFRLAVNYGMEQFEGVDLTISMYDIFLELFDMYAMDELGVYGMGLSYSEELEDDVSVEDIDPHMLELEMDRRNHFKIMSKYLVIYRLLYKGLSYLERNEAPQMLLDEHFSTLSTIEEQAILFTLSMIQGHYDGTTVGTVIEAGYDERFLRSLETLLLDYYPRLVENHFSK